LTDAEIERLMRKHLVTVHAAAAWISRNERLVAQLTVAALEELKRLRAMSRAVQRERDPLPSLAEIEELRRGA
jgi:hypothetical protein